MKVKDILTEMNVSHVSVAWVGVMFHRAVLYRIESWKLAQKAKAKVWLSLIIVQYDASIQGNDQGKGKLPLTKEEIQNVGKKSDGDVRKSIKALVTAAMPEEFPKFKAGLRSGTEPPIHPASHCIVKVSIMAWYYLFQGKCPWDGKG